MGVGRFFRHIGALCLLVAVGCLIVTDVTTPTTSLSMFRVSRGSSRIDFGTFGYCIHSSSNRQCTSTNIGYSPVDAIKSLFSNVDISDSTSTDTANLTKVMILHPIATGLAGIAFLLSFSVNFFASFLGTLVAFAGFCAAAVSLIVDFVNFAAIKAAIHDHVSSSINSKYREGSWTLLAATALLLIATVLLFFTCCSGRRERRGYYDKRGPA